jgi:hypothetical protein
VLHALLPAVRWRDALAHTYMTRYGQPCCKIDGADISNCVVGMVINRLSVLVSGFGVTHTTLVVVSGFFGMFQEVL